MKIAIIIIMSVVVFLFIGEFEISFNPFHVELPRWQLSVGLLLMSISTLLIMGSMYFIGYQDALKEAKYVLMKADDALKNIQNLIERIKEQEKDNDNRKDNLRNPMR